MSLVLKTILHKKWHMMLMLVLLSFVMMLSLQITVTLNSKNTSLAQRVDRVNGAHTNIYQTFHAQFDIQSVIQDLGTKQLMQLGFIVAIKSKISFWKDMFPGKQICLQSWKARH